MDPHEAVRGRREDFYRRLGQSLGREAISDDARGRLLKMSGYQSAIFELLPFHFLDLFPAVTPEQAVQVAYAGMLYMDYLTLEDAVVDGQPFQGQFVSAAIGGLIHEEALEIMRSLLGRCEAFWPWLLRYHHEYVAAVIAERDLQARRPPAYSAEERDRLAAGKCACGKVSLAALAFLDGAETPMEALARSYDAFSISSHLYDDLLDWRSDYAGGLYSYLIVQALVRCAPHHDGADRPTADELGRVIYYGGLAAETLAEAHNYAERALALVQGLGCPAWVATLRECQTLYARLSDDLAQLRERGLAQRASP
jgi:hypothetical protein